MKIRVIFKDSGVSNGMGENMFSTDFWNLREMRSDKGTPVGQMFSSSLDANMLY